MCSRRASSSRGPSRVCPMTAAFKYAPCSWPTPMGCVSMTDDTFMSARSTWRASTACSRWCNRSPTLLPKAIATGNSVTIPALVLRTGRHDLDPEDLSVSVAAEQVGAAGLGLLKDAEVLFHLTKNQLEHLAVPGIGDCVYARRPPFYEGTLVPHVGVDERLFVRV